MKRHQLYPVRSFPPLPGLFIPGLLPGVSLHSIESRAVDKFSDCIGKADFHSIFPAVFRDLCRTGFRSAFLADVPNLPGASSAAGYAHLLQELQDQPFIPLIPCRSGMKRFPQPKVLEKVCRRSTAEILRESFHPAVQHLRFSCSACGLRNSITHNYMLCLLLRTFFPILLICQYPYRHLVI